MKSGVSPDLVKVILELQSLPSFSEFALAGGTNLALRYSHRKSIDADFISTEVVGKSGLEEMIGEVTEKFGNRIHMASIINQGLGDRYMFIRMFIQSGDEMVKVEVLQNMKCLFDLEEVDGFRLVDKRDIGLFKLMSATNRFARKDIYDLDFITDEVPLLELFKLLSEKRKKFNKKEDECLFDLDIEKDLLEFPEMLLEFDTQKNTFERRPSHSHDRIDVLREANRG